MAKVTEYEVWEAGENPKAFIKAYGIKRWRQVRQAMLGLTKHDPVGKTVTRTAAQVATDLESQ